MIIKKVLNNNALITYNDRGQEVIVVGKGLAYNKKQGDRVNPNNVVKRFVLENQALTGAFGKIIMDISLEHVLLAEKIISHLKAAGLNLSDNIYITLTDHISVAIKRYQEKIIVVNPLLWDIKRLYPEEFSAACSALAFVQEKIGIAFSEDEAASITMHIKDAQLGMGDMMVFKIVELLNTVLKIIKYTFNLDYDQDSLAYHRLVTHLKFFAQRVLQDTNELPEVQNMDDLVHSYRYSRDCARIIKRYIDGNYDYIMTKNDVTFLTIHVENIRNSLKKYK